MDYPKMPTISLIFFGHEMNWAFFWKAKPSLPNGNQRQRRTVQQFQGQRPAPRVFAGADGGGEAEAIGSATAALGSRGLKGVTWTMAADG